MYYEKIETTDDVCDKVSTLSGETDIFVLYAYLDNAVSIVLRQLYPFGAPADAKVPEVYTYDLVNIAVYLLNKRGAEGEISHKDGDISRTYESGDVPDSLLRRIVPKAGVL